MLQCAVVSNPAAQIGGQLNRPSAMCTTDPGHVQCGPLIKAMRLHNRPSTPKRRPWAALYSRLAPSRLPWGAEVGLIPSRFWVPACRLDPRLDG